MSILKWLILLPFLLRQAMALDDAQARFYEAMELASTEGIPALVRKLDQIANTASSSPSAPQIHETILVIGLLHPGSVPDLSARLESLKGSASGNPGLGKVLRRFNILQAYYAAAVNGHPESGSAALSDPVFEECPYGTLARADAALRAHAYANAEMLALEVIENDPYSPLLSNAYMILGLSSAFQGNNGSALTHFQHALAASELPTIYGNPRDYAFTTYRFARPVPAAVGAIYDQAVPSPISAELKNPKALVFNGKNYILVEREMLLTVSTDGKVLDRKPVRKIEDVAVDGNGQMYSITEDSIDFGNGSVAALSLNAGKKTKRVDGLCSVAAGIGGDLYFLDKDAGLLRGTAAVQGGTLGLTAFVPVKGRIVRTDAWGNIYVLDKERIQIFSREGKPLASISPEPVAGKVGSLEFFALDALNHLYLLAENSIQIFALKNSTAGFEKSLVGTIAFDERPLFRNLKILGVNPAGELAVTGKSENNWVSFK